MSFTTNKERKDMKTYIIEKDIPLVSHKNIYPFNQMIVGDSFSYDVEDKKRITSAGSAYSRKHVGVKFTMRQGRCWRLA